MVLVRQLIFDSGEKTINPCRGWEGERGGIVREFGVDMYTLLYLEWISNKEFLYSTGNSAQRYVAACMGEEFGGEWIHVCGLPR